MNLQTIRQHLYEFSKAFPSAALQSYQTLSSIVQSVSSLSPKARQNLTKLTSFGFKLSKKVCISTINVYSYLMEKSLTRMYEWDEPSWLLLYPLATFICFIFPVTSFQPKINKEKVYLLIANRSVYSLDTIPLVCKLYLETGIWPRVAADAYSINCIYVY